jgi:hypothetical protein
MHCFIFQASNERSSFVVRTINRRTAFAVRWRWGGKRRTDRESPPTHQEGACESASPGDFYNGRCKSAWVSCLQSLWDILNILRWYRFVYSHDASISEPDSWSSSKFQTAVRRHRKWQRRRKINEAFIWVTRQSLQIMDDPIWNK